MAPQRGKTTPLLPSLLAKRGWEQMYRELPKHLLTLPAASDWQFEFRRRISVQQPLREFSSLSNPCTFEHSQHPVVKNLEFPAFAGPPGSVCFNTANFTCPLTLTWAKPTNNGSPCTFSRPLVTSQLYTTLQAALYPPPSAFCHFSFLDFPVSFGRWLEADWNCAICKNQRAPWICSATHHCFQCSTHLPKQSLTSTSSWLLQVKEMLNQIMSIFVN